MQIKTYPNNSKRIQTIETDQYAWDNDIDSDSVTHKASGRKIYQAHWVANGKMTERVDAETLDQVIKFWDAIETAKADFAAKRTTGTYIQSQNDYWVTDDGSLAEDY